MALEENGGMGTTMLVQPSGYPAYGCGNGGFGGFGQDGWWIILLFVLLGNNWGGNGGGYPYYTNESSYVQRGFDQASVMGGINALTSDVTNGFSNVQQSLCNGFAGVNATVNTGFANAETAANARAMADLQQTFALQSQLAQCLKHTVGTCAA